MFLIFPGPGGRLDPMRPQAASMGQATRWMRISALCLVPLLLTLAVGCHSSHTNNASDPGRPIVITSNPTDTTTVSGRSVTLSVAVTGAPTIQYQWSKNGHDILGAISSSYTLYNPKVSDSGAYTVTMINPIGTLTSASATLTVQGAVSFVAPVGVVADAAGNVFVSDSDDHTIWKVGPTHVRTLLAGMSGQPGINDGKGALAQFNAPGGLALDPAGNLLVADTGNHTIRRIAPDGTVTTVAGSAGNPGSADGAGILATFNGPSSLAVDASGVVYIADSLNHTIRQMSATGAVTTYAGIAGQPGQNDGAAATAQFSQPNGLALAPNGTLYVADYGNSVIRAISSSGAVSRYAGVYYFHSLLDGNLATAQFYQPMGLALDAAGTLYVADTGNNSLRKITAGGAVTVLAGTSTFGNVDGQGTLALFHLPSGITLAPSGNLVVADTGNHYLRSVTPAGLVTTYLVP